MSTPVLTAEFTEPLHLTGDLPKPINWLAFESESKTIVFDDGATVYGYNSRCRRIFAIAQRARLNGWAYDGSNLFVQDGPVLSQYDLMSLDPRTDALPVKALNLETRQKWSSDQSTDNLTALFPSPASTSQFSAPVIWNKDPAGVFVSVLMVADQTKIVRVPANLNPHPWEQWTTAAAPDAPLEMFAGDSPDGPFLQFLSGGQVLTVRMHPMGQVNQQAPVESAEHSRRLGHANIATATGQAQQSIRIPSGRGDADLWACALSSGGAQVYAAPNYQGAKARIGWAAGPGSPAGGDLGADGDPRTLRSIPAMSQEHHENYVFVLASDHQGAIRLEKYKLAESLGGVSAHARALLDSQLKGIAPWLVAVAKGAPASTQVVPFDANSSVVCAGGLLGALGIADAGINAKLAGAGSAAAEEMMTIARQSGADLPVAVAICRLCSVVIGRLLAGGYYEPGQTTAALRAAGLSVREVLGYLAPASIAPGNPYQSWWQGAHVSHRNPFAWPPMPPEPQPVSDQGNSVAGLIQRAGYSADDVAHSLMISANNLEMLHATIAILKSAYGYGYDNSKALALKAAGDNGNGGGDMPSNITIPLCTFFARDCLGWP